MEKKEENKMEEIFTKIYEVGYHIIPAVSVENLAGEVDKIKNFLTENGVEIISEEFPRLIDLAYTMPRVVGGARRKFDTAYFGWIKFDAGEAPIAKIKKFFEEDGNILRFLLINTVKENTVFSAKVPDVQVREDIKDVKIKSESEKKEIKSPISQDELDKTIDKLIAE